METLIFYCTHGLMALCIIVIFSAGGYHTLPLKVFRIRCRKLLISPGPILKAIYRFY